MTQPPEHIMQYFKPGNEPRLLTITTPIDDAAHHLFRELPRNPERTVALRKLLEAREAAVRAATSNLMEPQNV